MLECHAEQSLHFAPLFGCHRVQSRVQHLPDEEQDKAYQPLHEKYAPKVCFTTVWIQCLLIVLHTPS